MRKSFLYFLFLALILLPSSASADKFTLTSYYPAPFGSYKSIALTPQPALPSSNCHIGTIYANASDNSLLYYCTPTTPLSSFLPFPGVWTLNGNDLYLTDTTTPANKRVGIGTVTPTFKLTLANDGGILADNVNGSSSVLPVSGAGTRLIWYPAHGAFRAGHAPNNEWNDSSMGQSSMAMGHGNQAFTDYSTVWGGKNNSTNANPTVAAVGYEVIAGGKDNSATHEYAQILGGEENTATNHSRVSGKSNTADYYGTIGGGEDNFVKSNKFDVLWSTVAGGHANIINGDVSPIGATVSHADYATISGGEANIASATYTTISGGRQNTMLPLDSDDLAMVPPSSLGPAYGTIAGGHLNRISKYTTSSFFFPNNSDSPYSLISGGQSNTVAGEASTISGGLNNIVDAGAATVSGGNGNICRNAFCSIAGGNIITVTGQHATALGGSTNTVSGRNSIIPGGQNNTAGASYSLAAGHNMALSTGVGSKNTFLWGYSQSAITPIGVANTFIIYSGVMGIRDTTPAAYLEINGNGGSADNYLNLTSTSSAAAGDVLTIKNNGTIGVGVTTLDANKVMQFANGAYVDATGNFMPASSRAYKENITDLNLSKAMDAFYKLQPVRYNYKNEKDEEYLGFIAEDVPHLVADKNRQGLAPMDIAAVLTKVIAQQQTTLKAQQEESQQLLEEIKELKTRFEKLKHQE